MPLDVARRGTLDVRDPPLKAIVAANDSYEAGYHKGNAGGLDAIDTDLATANIKNGITIFGKVGSADVHDISDATAVEAEVLDPETFYAVGGGIRTGTMPTVAITAVNDNYPAGYHAGNVGGLSAIDVNLAAANILSGVNIFGFVGPATVQDIADANALVGEVLNPRTFYSVTGARKTGTMPTVALAPGSSAYPAGYHVGDGGGLPAIDGDLVTANIKNGITIFNVAGHVNVRDVSDANALVGEVMNGRTFYAVGGAIKTGTLPTRTLNPANENVLAGYYAGTTLSTVEVQLAAANILSGVNIFGFVGVATVQDIADANALVGEVLNPRTFYSVTGARKTGTMATVALAPGSNAYPAGYHVGAANLTAVDGDLVTANIKNGITIFNVAGHVNVRDVSDANALVGEVMNGRTFYAVGGAIKTGTLATVALAAGANAYPQGYHVGAANLTAVDGDLVTGSIKFGVTIFGVAGHTNVRDSTDANLTAPEAPTGKTFYAGGGARKTGSGTKTLNPANENVAAGYYAATTLSAVDVHLAAANIKDGVNIFGFVGTFVGGALAEDVTGSTQSTLQSLTTGGVIYHDSHQISGETEEDIVSITKTYNDPSLTVASVVLVLQTGTDFTLRLYMDGVQVAESPQFTIWKEEILVATRAMAGSNKICKAAVYNTSVSAAFWDPYVDNTTSHNYCCYIMVGSVKH